MSLEIFAVAQCLYNTFGFNKMEVGKISKSVKNEFVNTAPVYLGVLPDLYSSCTMIRFNLRRPGVWQQSLCSTVLVCPLITVQILSFSVAISSLFCRYPTINQFLFVNYPVHNSVFIMLYRTRYLSNCVFFPLTFPLKHEIQGCLTAECPSGIVHSEHTLLSLIVSGRRDLLVSMRLPVRRGFLSWSPDYETLNHFLIDVCWPSCRWLHGWQRGWQTLSNKTSISVGDQLMLHQTYNVQPPPPPLKVTICNDKHLHWIPSHLNLSNFNFFLSQKWLIVWSLMKGNIKALLYFYHFAEY